MNEACNQFEAILTGPDAHEAHHQAWLADHEAHCETCRALRHRLELVDQVAAAAGEQCPTPGPLARARLEAQWRRLAVRRGWRDRLRHAWRTTWAPEVLEPLMPHVAMIVGFIFFTWSITLVQMETGWLTLQSWDGPMLARAFEVAASRIMGANIFLI